METTETKKREKKEHDRVYTGNELTIKGLITALLIVFLLFPAHLINNLIKERQQREKEVIKEVSESWSAGQTLTGPILIIPYESNVPGKSQNKNTDLANYVCILPENLDIRGNILPFQRHRSIFNVTVYEADLIFSGEFSTISPEILQIKEEDLLLDQAILYFGLSDFKGVRDQIVVTFNNKEYPLNKSLLALPSYGKELTASIDLTGIFTKEKNTFSFPVNIKGSGELNFVPVGKTTTTTIDSSWGNPSFTGNFIPSDPATVTDKGFTATWKILDLNRNYPQIWKDNFYKVSSSTYGVTLLSSSDSYAKTERSVKYAILFITLTFALYFFMEIFQNKKVHPLQYVLVGCALCIFYVLLLSVSEYLGFNIAYLIAALAVILLISFYTQMAFRNKKTALIFGSMLSVLYFFIFVLIQLQDGALLVGSIGLFFLLAFIMYFTSKINWYRNENI